MSERRPSGRNGSIGWIVVAWLSCTSGAPAGELSNIPETLDERRLDEAVKALFAEVEENPAHQSARMRLAEAYEEAGMTDQAIAAWKDLIKVSRNDSNLHTARKSLSRLRRRMREKDDIGDLTSGGERDDPFKIPMPEVEWEGLEIVEDSKYLPPIPGHPFEVPPFVEETKYFTVYSANERLSRVIGQRAELYLEFMIDRLFGGRGWALRFPIVVYTTQADYQRHGGPAGTGGVTMGHISGKTQGILLYQLRSGSTHGRRRTGRGQGIWRYGLESVLPHELTHAVVNEFFAGRPAPRWLHEAIAGRFEQTRDHYGEAARLARSVAAGEYFRLRDLFEQKGYPERVQLFYEQSATIVLYLFETGHETMHVFLTELAAGNGHDAACAAALGIPEENAVEEFERRWVDWMRARYIKDLNRAADDTVSAEARKSDHAVFRPHVSEPTTVEQIRDWRKIDLHSLDGFAGIGESIREWSVEGGFLRCNVKGQGASTLLAIRMSESPPVAISCTVRSLSDLGDRNRWLGFTQLDGDLNDTRVEVIAPLWNNAPQRLVCIWSDELALYLGKTCVGRYPARSFVSGDAPDIDYPLALVAYGPVEIQDLRIASIKEFYGEPAVEPEKKRRRPRQRPKPQPPKKRRPPRRP